MGPVQLGAASPTISPSAGMGWWRRLDNGDLDAELARGGGHLAADEARRR